MERRVLAMIFWSPGNGDESAKMPLKLAFYRTENEMGDWILKIGKGVKISNLPNFFSDLVASLAGFDWWVPRQGLLEFGAEVIG